MDEQDRKRSVVQKTVWKGVSFGSVLAMVISYCNWHSVGWAIFHGLLEPCLLYTSDAADD